MSAGAPKQAVLGVALLSFILGTLHAFSILLIPMEQAFEVSRSAASATYSIALASLAVAVLLGHRLYERLSPPIYIVLTGVLAAMGCTLAALGPSMVFVWLGFGLIFGGANGLGYGYALQFSGRALPRSRGFAMGAVTAAYAFGAVVFPVPLRVAIDAGGWRVALLFLALCLLLVSALSALTLFRSRVLYAPDTTPSSDFASGAGRQVMWLWLSYCGAVTAGLMAIGHATGLAEARGSGFFWITAAPIVIASANMAGSLLGGVLTDRMGGRSVLSWLALLSAVALLTMAVSHQLTSTLIGLAIIGLSYGGTIAAYPAYISHQFGASRGTIVYGRVFTAWAAAGLLGPSVAGMLFDRYQNYQIALVLAALAATISLALILTNAYGGSEAAYRDMRR